MPLSPVQLLDPNFRPITQGCLWSGTSRSLRYVIKLHQATQLHYDLRFELYGRLLSFAISDLVNCWKTTVPIARVSDHDPKHIFGERCIPTGSYGAGPMLVWDHGIYRSDLGSEEDVYRQLLNGDLEIELQGMRLNGRFRIQSNGKNWSIQRLSGTLAPNSNHSVLTGRTLDEIEDGINLPKSAHSLWLEWEGFLTTQTAEPEIVVHEKRVIDLNFAAKTRGISNGMSLQHVLPLIPNCRVTPFAPDPKRETAWLDHLIPYSDTIQPFDYNSTAVDLTGHPDPGDIAGKIVTRLTKADFGYLHYGTGPSLWIARLAAQLKDPFGFAVDPVRRLAPLAIEHFLAISEQDRERLQRLGFETIGEIAATAPEQLYQQFGKSTHHIITAAQVKTRERIVPMYPSRATVVTLWFSAPVNNSLALEKAAETLACRLAEKINGQQAGLAILTAASEDGTERTIQRSYKRHIHTPDSIRASLSYLTAELQKVSPDIVRLTARLDRLEPQKSCQQELYVAALRADYQTVLDSINSSLGDKSIVLARDIEIPRREQVLKAWRNATGWN